MNERLYDVMAGNTVPTPQHRTSALNSDHKTHKKVFRFAAVPLCSRSALRIEIIWKSLLIGTVAKRNTNFRILWLPGDRMTSQNFVQQFTDWQLHSVAFVTWSPG